MIPVFVALDVDTREEALHWVKLLSPLGFRFKVGMQLFYKEGLPLVQEIQQDYQTEVFVDLKLHDIPNTVAQSARQLAQAGVSFLNVHCLGGFEMMRGAAEAAKAVNPAVTVLGVTILTSHTPEGLAEDLKSSLNLTEMVAHLAGRAQAAGLDGVVCSPLEAPVLRGACGPDFLLVTPGVRPVGADVQDQARILTPQAALAAGASHLVVGRPITAAPDPLAVARDLAALFNSPISA
jgi:orotidine-5'-phosphate decarboxylase